MGLKFDPEMFSMTIRECSYDDAKKQILVDRDLVVYNFDKIKEFVCRRLRDNAFVRSCDAYYNDGQGGEYLIEFKNQRPEDVPRREIKQKAFDSLYLLMLTFHPDSTIEELAKRVTLIIVYNEHAGKGPARSRANKSESFDRMAEHFGKLAGVNQPRSAQFGLSYLKGQLYRSVYTLDTRDFVGRFIDRQFCREERPQKYPESERRKNASE